MKEILIKLVEKFADISILTEEERHACIFLNEKNDLQKIVSFCKNELRFKMLIDICGADYPTNDRRFEVIYQFLNLEDNMRLTIKLRVSEAEDVPTIDSIHSCANWFERETFDMYGIPFAGSKDMRRILTDYNFEGFPLRKDFPLTGFKELQYDVSLEKIVEVPVNLSQEYRNFDFETPWETVQYSIKK